VNHEEAIAKAKELDRFLTKAKRELMPITDGEPILSMKDLIADIKAAKNEFRAGIHKELSGMAADIRANGALAVDKVRTERKSARDEFTELLGNEIVEGEDQTKSDDKAGG
jgi:pyruvate formate-lyase activating enzyme-like uncharacterized protein